MAERAPAFPTAQEVGQYSYIVYYLDSQHTGKVVGEYAYCLGSKQLG